MVARYGCGFAVMVFFVDISCFRLLSTSAAVLVMRVGLARIAGNGARRIEAEIGMGSGGMTWNVENRAKEELHVR